jgi:uracil-DNA glycosylase
MNPAAAARAGQPLLVTNFAEWREAARELLVYAVPPETVNWGAPGGDLFSDAAQATADGGDLLSGAPADAPASHNSAEPLPAAVPGSLRLPGHVSQPAPQRLTEPGAPPVPQPAPHLPRSLMDLLQTAACCRQADRWAFLYRVVWRWAGGDHAVQSAADADGARLHAMVKAVHREEHDMHAYIRFRERPAQLGPPRFVAWFEPRHDVLPQVAQHFVSRMGKVSWMIATPDASVLWDGATLHNCGPLVDSAADLVDHGEALWLTYYRSIFNPARVNAPLLYSHIPSRFWKGLPEGALVPQMVSQAALGERRTGQAQAVGRKPGAIIPITPDDAQPERQQPSKLEECRRCDLWQHATQAVPGEGPKRAKIMLVGEQPGDQEDLAGEPFVGPAGKLLDRVCEEAGVDRDKLYVTNAVKHFKWEPRGKRRMHKTPAQREIEACNYWLDKELAAVKPQVIVALGTTALKSLLGTSHVTLKDTIGQALRHEGRWIVTIYHPSYVLRVPDEAAKKEAFKVMVEGLKMAQGLLDKPEG